MAMPTTEVVSVSPDEPRSRTELVLEMIALRHQIAVLKRSGTRRPCFGFWDRLFWTLLSWWWPRWTESLLIIQPETVKRWRRGGWWGLWRYRSRGRWRGGRPKVSGEVRGLITRMARENFLWGAPRIHGELLMLGFKVSQATVSRYLSTLHRHPGQSWRTFIRNQALGFRYSYDLDYGNQDYQSFVDCSYRGKFAGSAERIVRPDADNRGTSHSRGIAIRARRRTRGDRLRTFRCDRAPGRSLIARANPLSVSVQMRGPPHHTEIFQSSALAIGEWRGLGFEKRQFRIAHEAKTWMAFHQRRSGRVAGGCARAASAKRDARGRYVPDVRPRTTPEIT